MRMKPDLGSSSSTRLLLLIPDAPARLNTSGSPSGSVAVSWPIRSPGLAFFGAPAPSLSDRLVGARFAASIRIFFVISFIYLKFCSLIKISIGKTYLHKNT